MEKCTAVCQEHEFMKTKKVFVTKTTSLENTLATKERYNPYQGGHGVHKTDKHPSRARRKVLYQKYTD